MQRFLGFWLWFVIKSRDCEETCLWCNIMGGFQLKYKKQLHCKMSMKKALEKLVKRCAVVGIILGEDPTRDHWSWTLSFDYYKGKVILERPPLDLGTDVRLSRSLQCLLSQNGCILRDTEAPGVGQYSPFEDKKTSLISPEMPKDSLGWPLLLGKTNTSPENSQNDKTRVMTPASALATILKQIDLHPNRISVTFNEENECSNPDACALGGVVHARGMKKELLSESINFSGTRNLDHGYEVSSSFGSILREICSSPARWKLINKFGYDELKIATSGFSSENLIGEGGCSNVYKGVLPSGKAIAIKILKPYSEASNDFYLEVDIVSSLKHKNISPLLGVCIESGHLISVYDFFPEGSLDERLHGQNGRHVMPWDARFKLAVATAEALNYLHNKNPCPVIHRDVKSSNILLSDDLQPQLSDFGLAMWRPIDSSYVTDSNAVGTFGYLAPEYIMEGGVSDKIDVYSFGVVLLELLSGRRPISHVSFEGKQSLVQWAKSLLGTGNVGGLLDPKLNGCFEVDQILRMVLASSICISQAPQNRPNIGKILELFIGEKDPGKWYEEHVNRLQHSSYLAEDLLPQCFDCRGQFGLLFRRADAYAKPLDNHQRADEHERRPKLKDFLKEPQD